MVADGDALEMNLWRGAGRDGVVGVDFEQSAMGAEEKLTVLMTRGGRGEVAAGLDAGKAIVPTVSLAVKVSVMAEEIFEGDAKESPVGCDPEIAVVIVLDLGEVVVVEAILCGKPLIDLVLEVTKSVAGVSDPKAAIGSRVEGADGAIGGAVDF